MKENSLTIPTMKDVIGFISPDSSFWTPVGSIKHPVLRDGIMTSISMIKRDNSFC